MIGSSDNSGGVAWWLGLLCVEQNVAGSNLASYFDFFFSFHLSNFFLSSCEPAKPFQHGASIACCNCYHRSML